MDQISRFVTNETLLYHCQKLLNNIGNSYHALPKTALFHRKIKCSMNEEIVATATVIVMKIIDVNLNRGEKKKKSILF